MPTPASVTAKTTPAAPDCAPNRTSSVIRSAVGELRRSSQEVRQHLLPDDCGSSRRQTIRRRRRHATFLHTRVYGFFLAAFSRVLFRSGTGVCVRIGQRVRMIRCEQIYSLNG